MKLDSYYSKLDFEYALIFCPNEYLHRDLRFFLDIRLWKAYFQRFERLCFADILCILIFVSSLRTNDRYVLRDWLMYQNWYSGANNYLRGCLATFFFSLGISVPNNRQKYKQFGTPDIGRMLRSKWFWFMLFTF